MLAAPKRPEIDHRTMKLIVGVIATSLAPLTSHFASSAIASVSAAYYEGGWSQSILIGFLFAIAAFLLAYNGTTRVEMLLSKLAAVAGLCIAFFPCGCDGHTEVIPYVHELSAATMFLILAYFCLGFLREARAQGHPQAITRAVIYAVCGIAILLAIFLMGLDWLVGGALTRLMPRFTFYGETAALTAFGVSWLTASHTLPFITRKGERFSPLKESNPN